MCLNEAYHAVHISKNLSANFPPENDLKQGEALSSLLFNFAFECAIRNIQENKEGMNLNSTYQLSTYADDVKIYGGNTYAINKYKLYQRLVRRLV
jgi:hypothetical protein